MRKPGRLSDPCVAACAAAFALLSLSGCKPTQPATPADAIGEVGGIVLTTTDLNREFALAGIPEDKRGEDETRVILGNLVTRKYLAAKALAARLDSDPQVAGDLARTREQILSAAFSQVEAKDKTLGITDADVNAFITSHPRAFAKHVVYLVDQVATPLQGDVARYAAMTEDAKTLDEIETKLDTLKVPRSRSRSELDGGAITQGLADALAGQTPDAVFFARRDNLGVFFKVLSVDSRPVSGDAAKTQAYTSLRYDLLDKIAEADAASALQATKFSGDYARLMAGAKKGP